MNKFFKLLLAVSLFVTVLPAQADANKNGGLVDYSVNGAVKMQPTADQVYGTNHAGTDVEAKTVQGTAAAGITVTHTANHITVGGQTGTANQVFGENNAGTGVEAKTVSGTGGITVTLSGANAIVLDGSAVVGTNPGTGFTASNKATSFSAAVNNVYFVTATATATLPTAAAVAGKQIKIVNNSAAQTITFATTSAQTMNGTASGALTNATRYDVFTFTSDGANWMYEHTVTP